MSSKAKLKQLERKWDNADKWVKRVIGAVTTCGVIAGMFCGLFSWGIGQLDGFVNAKLQDVTAQVVEVQADITRQVSTVKQELLDIENESRLGRTRLELTTLIAHSPTNVLEIEKVARYYFVDLGGDWYMSQIYSDWAKQYGGDMTFVTHK